MVNTTSQPVVNAEALLFAPNAEYYIHLLLAINDLASTTSLLDIVDKEANQGRLMKYIAEGIHLYLMRMSAGHLVEMAEILNFKERHPKNDVHHALYEPLNKDSNLLNQYDEIIALLKNGNGTKPTNKDLYSQMCQVRNNIAFHYSHKLIKKARTGAVNWLKENGRQKIPIMSFGETPNLLRFPVADLSASITWSEINKDEPDGNTEITQIAKNYRTKLGRTIIAFVQNILIVWFEKHKIKIEAS